MALKRLTCISWFCLLAALFDTVRTVTVGLLDASEFPDGERRNALNKDLPLDVGGVGVAGATEAGVATVAIAAFEEELYIP